MDPKQLSIWKRMLARSFEPRQWFEEGDRPCSSVAVGGRIMWVYTARSSSMWVVGFYSPDGTWNQESSYNSKDSAAARVHWLNGGENKPPGH